MVQEHERQSVVASLQECRLEIRLGIEHEELHEGPEAESILKVAESRKADLIVMGTRGLGMLKSYLVGSVSRKVIHHASCPVMVAT